MIKEVELKYRLPNKSSYEHFLNSFKGKHVVENQTNYFFDTPDLKLKKEHIFVRLRKVGNTHIITCKAKPLGGNCHPGLEPGSSTNLISIHDEWEHYVDTEVANTFLHVKLDATDYLRAWFQKESAEQEKTRLSLLKRIQAITTEPLGLVGSFTNTRTRIPYKIGKHKLDFEVDATNFGNKRVDYEVELELPKTLDPKQAQSELSKLFETLKLETSKSTGKAERFFALSLNQPVA